MTPMERISVGDMVAVGPKDSERMLQHRQHDEERAEREAYDEQLFADRFGEGAKKRTGKR